MIGVTAERVRLPWGVLMVPSVYQVANPASPAAVAAGTANMGYYQSFWLPYATPLLSMSFYCATGTNNHDLGIYEGTTRLVSRGSTATTAGAENTWTLTTPLWLQANTLYYAAISTAGTKTISRFAIGTSILNPRFGRAIQAIGAVALPDPAVFAVPAADAMIPLLKLTFAF